MKIKNILEVKKILNIFNNNYYLGLYQDNGLNSKELIELKKQIKNYDFKIIRFKNSLVRLALEKTKYNYFLNLFEGPSIIIYADNNNSNYQQLYSFHKKFNKLDPMGGILNNDYLSAKQFDWIFELSHSLEPYSLVINYLELPAQLTLNGLSLQGINISYLVDKK